MDLSLKKINLGIFKVFRLLRILRPLKLASKNEGLRISIQALLVSIPKVFNVLMISFLFFLIFGIIGVNYFKGRLYSCESDHISELPFKIVTKWDCINSGGVWINYIVNFDNIVEAMAALFAMANAVGWAAFMYAGISTVGID